MAWLQVHQTLKDHRKLFDAADQLEVEPPHMMGLLVSFWLWALDNAPTGSLVDITPRMISRAAQWDGDPEKLAKTLIRAGWIDEKEDGTLEIHDWYEYAGKLIDQRQAEKERSRSRRAAAAASADASPDDPTPTAGRPANSRKKAGGRVDQSREDKTREGNTPPSPSDEGSDSGTKSLVEARFLEFWKAYPKKTGKQYALKAWNKIKPTAELHERIMQAVDAQKRSDQWRRENGRYIPNPSTWLNGGYFENIISASCDYYLSRGLAKIEKTPEPMKPLGAKNRKGQFLACYTKQAQPDYGGTLKGGRSIYFEAKHTDDERIEQRRLTQEQQDDLEAHHKLGAVAFVLVSVSLTDFYRVPWPVWRDMAEIYGRKYMTHAELSRYEVPATAGFIKFLHGIESEVLGKEATT